MITGLCVPDALRSGGTQKTIATARGGPIRGEAAIPTGRNRCRRPCRRRLSQSASLRRLRSLHIATLQSQAAFPTPREVSIKCCGQTGYVDCHRLSLLGMPVATEFAR